MYFGHENYMDKINNTNISMIDILKCRISLLIFKLLDLYVFIHNFLNYLKILNTYCIICKIIKIEIGNSWYIIKQNFHV